MPGNDFNVGWSTIRFFMQVLDSRKEYVTSYVREKDILFHLKLSRFDASSPQGVRHDTADVVLAGEYITSEASVLEFHTAFPSAKFIVLGGNWWKYTSEAHAAACAYGIKLMGLKEFLSAIRAKNLVE